jgi:hypothetical protein
MGQGSRATLASDFAAGLYQIKALGFNAIKLPFSFPNLFGTPPAPLQAACPLLSTPDLFVSPRLVSGTTCCPTHMASLNSRKLICGFFFCSTGAAALRPTLKLTPCHHIVDGTLGRVLRAHREVQGCVCLGVNGYYQQPGRERCKRWMSPICGRERGARPPCCALIS